MKNKKLLFNVLVIIAGVAILSLSASDSLMNHEFKSPVEAKDGTETSAQYLAMLRNNQNTGTVELADILEAQQMSMKSVGFNQNIQWVNAGPDNYAGRTRAVLFDNRDTQLKTVYAASVSGGIWKSTTGGILWNPVPGTGNIMNVTTMVQASNGVIYVGTGETFRVFQFAAYPGFAGNGVFKSSATGDDFQVLPATVPAQNDTTAAWAYVNKLAVHPSNPQVLYAATQGGLMYSGNGGNTWSLATDTTNAALNLSASDVRIGSDGITAATVNDLVYISNTGDPTKFILYSTGTTSQRLPFQGISRTELAIAPSNPDYIYAVITRGSPSLGQLDNIYLSTNRGNTWRIVGPGASTFFNVFGADNVGVYANCPIVHPTNPDVLLVGGRSLWQGTKIQDDGFYDWRNKSITEPGSDDPNFNVHSIAFKPGDPNTVMIGTDRGVFLSTNGLNSFQNMNRFYITDQCYSVAFNSGKRLLAGTQSNGVLHIKESGNTNGYAERFDFDGLNGGNVAMSLINQRAFIWSKGIPANSTAQSVPLFRSDDLGATVALAPFENLRSETVITNPTTIRNLLPAMLYWESFNFTSSRDSVTYFARDTVQAGSTVWVRSANSRYPFKHTISQTMYPDDSIRVQDTIASRLFYGLQPTSSTYFVFMTKHAVQFTRGAVWYRILAPLGVPQSFGISKDGDHLWVGTRNGMLYRVSNLTQAYDSITADFRSSQCVTGRLTLNNFQNRIITSIAVDPQNPNHVIVTLGNYGNDHYVFRSTNATAANPVFTSIQGSLPKMPVYSALIEMSNPNIAILGTDMGIYSTTDINAASPAWEPENGNMGNVAVFQLKQQLLNIPPVTVQVDQNTTEVFPGVDNYGNIYAATFGRGVYKTSHFQIVGTNDLPAVNNKSSNRLNIYPNPASDWLSISYLNSKNNPVEVSVVDLSGRSILKQNFGILNSGTNTLQMDIRGVNKGVYMIILNNGEENISNKLIIK